MRRYSVEQEKILKKIDFCHLRENIKTIIWCSTKRFQKIVHRGGEVWGNEIADAVTKSYDDEIGK